MISLKDALDTMNKLDQFGKPVPFSCVYCTFSRQRQTGGTLIKIERATINTPKKKSPQKKKLLRWLPKKVANTRSTTTTKLATSNLCLVAKLESFVYACCLNLTDNR